METGKLIKRIGEVFPWKPVPQPGEILYNEEEGYSGSFPVEEELMEIREFFGGRSWKTIAPQDVFAFRHALSFFSAHAFRYFTPAWMTCVLIDPAATDTGAEDLISSLKRRPATYWIEGQRGVICMWLNYLMRPREGNLPPRLIEEATKSFDSWVAARWPLAAMRGKEGHLEVGLKFERDTLKPDASNGSSQRTRDPVLGNHRDRIWSRTAW